MIETSTPSLGRQVVRGSAFMVGLRFGTRLIGLTSTLILVRLLTPRDFGIVALAHSFFGMLDVLTSLSFPLALIRLPTVERAHFDTAWTLGIVRGWVIGGILAATAGLAASVTDEPRVVPLIWVLSGVAVFQGFENIGIVDFRRNLQFDKVFRYQIVFKLTAFLVCIPLAFIFRSYWALIAGSVGGRVTLVAYSYVIHPYRPRLSLAKARELFHFSKWLFLQNLLVLANSYTPIILFGRIGGAATVGIYQASMEIGSLPASEISAPIRDPIYAGYAKLLDDRASLRRNFVQGLGVLLFTIVPLSVGLALTARLITPLCLGPQWSAAASLIPICAIYALLEDICPFASMVAVVLNRQGWQVLASAIIVGIRVPAIVVAGYVWNIEAAVFALAATAGLNAVLQLWRACSLLELSTTDLLRPIWRTVVSAGVMAAVLLAFADLRADGLTTGALLLHTIVVALYGAAVHVSTQLGLWALCGRPDGPEAYSLRSLRWLLSRLMARPQLT